MSQLGRTDILLFFAGCFVTGIVLLTQISSKNVTDETAPYSSAGYWIARILVYVSAGYIVAYMGLMSNTTYRFWLLFAGVVIVSFSLTLWRRWQLNLMINKLTAVQTKAWDDIDKCEDYRDSANYFKQLGFIESRNMHELIEVLRLEVEASHVTRLIAYNVDKFISESGAIGVVLMDAVRAGKDVRILSACPSKLWSRQQLELKMVPFEFEEFWLIQTTWSIYVILAGDSNCIVKLRRATSASKVNLPAVGLDLLIERIERRASDQSRIASATARQGPEAYRDLIASLERSAMKIDRIAKRIFVVFKDDDTIRTIAEQRYGEGSSYLMEYMQEHAERRRIFESAIKRGAIFREIYSCSELISYVKSGKHGVSAILQRRHLVAMISNWIDAIRTIPNYHVALTDEPVPFHYEIVDDKHVVFHEAIGVHESTRVNSIFLDGYGTASDFRVEFDALWDRVPLERRKSEGVIAWIEMHILSTL
mgnify:CR=1 FL=1